MRPEPAFQPETETNDVDVVDAFLRRAPAAMISLIVHLLVLIVLAIVSYRSEQSEPLVIEIGEAAESPAPEIDSIVIEAMEPEIEPKVEKIVSIVVDVPAIEVVSTTVAPELIGTRLISSSNEGYSPSFSNRIRDAQQYGIEIVVVFDSTGSMGREIDSVKQRIREIGAAVLDKIPRARFSLATYRDSADEYLVRGITLSDDLSRIQSFIGGVSANGGGDRPEAVQSGMRWAMQENPYRAEAQKVMLIFGDAPPHSRDMQECLQLAEEFRDYGKGQVYTVSCRAPTPMPEFYAIARAGGGEAYIMMNLDRLMEDLLVITFGVENRQQVLRFFDLPSNRPDLNRAMQRRGMPQRSRRRR